MAISNSGRARELLGCIYSGMHMTDAAECCGMTASIARSLIDKIESFTPGVRIYDQRRLTKHGVQFLRWLIEGES